MSIKTPKIAFIRARWHADIVDQAFEGFKAQAVSDGFAAENISVFDAPGGFEMPLLAKKLAETKQFDAIVAAAWVVDGGIYRHDFVASAVVDGLMAAQMATGVPVFSVSLTPHNYQETQFHNDTYIKHMYQKGQEAADAVAGQLKTLAMIEAM
uniref:6,7-dimethyl-8-ribityllumazine synthase n=1 Tax=uncultured Thiotrichaceae bacterium TaxID=298394 RepID=A0A6S6T253_9GAMM|nr:MAG: 6,7-dimethyl-8-ribityllumazine synthase (EC [uncultured Thiotrichaceae bacterium]